MYCLGTPEREITDGDTLLLLGQQDIGTGRLHIHINASELEQQSHFLISYSMHLSHNRLKCKLKQKYHLYKIFYFLRKTRGRHEHKQLPAGNTNVIRSRIVVGVHPKILQFDFSPSIIIPIGKHNATYSQKNYRAALQKTNNLLALCLTEQHCQSARNHPF